MGQNMAHLDQNTGAELGTSRAAGHYSTSGLLVPALLYLCTPNNTDWLVYCAWFFLTAGHHFIINACREEQCSKAHALFAHCNEVT